MTCKLNPSAPRLILFAGHAGTGKTTLAKKALPLIIEKTGEDFFFLDKDTVYGAYSAHVMEITTKNPNDRDSPYYLKNLRNWEYAGLIAIAREIPTSDLSITERCQVVGVVRWDIRAHVVHTLGRRTCLSIPYNSTK